MIRHRVIQQIKRGQPACQPENQPGDNQTHTEPQPDNDRTQPFSLPASDQGVETEETQQRQDRKVSEGQDATNQSGSGKPRPTAPGVQPMQQNPEGYQSQQRINRVPGRREHHQRWNQRRPAYCKTRGFDHAQAPLSYTFFDFWMFWRADQHWYSARELTALGVDELLEDMGKNVRS